MPKFVVQRSLYEVRERPSKAYSWSAFLIANVIVEIPWQTLAGVISWASYYFPIYDSHQSPQRQGLMLLFVTQFYLFTSTFASFIIAALPDAETGGTIATLLFIMATVFNGVMQPPNALPGFWIFMYRVSPLTYLIAGLTATGLHDRPIICSPEELSVFNPSPGMTCGEYLGPYLQKAPGRLSNPAATHGCEYCQFRSADQYLSMTNICEFSHSHHISTSTSVFEIFPHANHENSLERALAQLRPRMGLHRIQHHGHSRPVLPIPSQALQPHISDPGPRAGRQVPVPGVQATLRRDTQGEGGREWTIGLIVLRSIRGVLYYVMDALFCIVLSCYLAVDLFKPCMHIEESI